MERLQKVMAHAGVASRRKSEEIISQGRVKVNGEIVKSPGTKVSPADEIEVDDKIINTEEKVYYLFHKPAQVISTLADELGRTTVADYFIEVPERVYPVGRLDYDTTGLLLMTNDGELTHELMHPSFEVVKTYEAKVLGHVDQSAIDKLEQGIELEDGLTAPARAELLRTWKNPARSLVSLSIHEGRNHQVKRMLEAVGHSVVELQRTSYGPLELADLEAGEFRELTGDELTALREV